jgi:hypothetical protein
MIIQNTQYTVYSLCLSVLLSLNLTRLMSIIIKLNLEKKNKGLKSFNWSKNDFLSAFSVQPMLMIYSVKKIRDLINFLTTNVGLMP